MNSMELDRLIDRLLPEVEWIHPEWDLYDGDTVAFRHGGRTVRGTVSLSPRRVTVTMQRAEGDLSLEATMDADMPLIFTEHPYEESPASPAGRDRAQRLLLGLYLSEEGSSRSS